MREIKDYLKILFRSSKKWYVFFCGGIIVFVLVLAFTLYGWFQMLKETGANSGMEAQLENVTNFGTEIQSDCMEENVPNFGTLDIGNLNEMAAPLLGNEINLLEQELSRYVLRNEMKETECTIIHVMIPEQNENQIFFFGQFLSSGEIVQVVFDREKDVFITLKSYYTSEEVVDEIWNGECPADRDIQE